MSHIAAQTKAMGGAAATSTAAADATSSTSRVRASESAGASTMAQHIAAMPDPVRLQMRVIAQTSLNEDHALEQVIALLVPGSARKQSAVIAAFRSNESLRTQWQRTFELLQA